MMGMTMPTQSSLTDLMTLLQLLQAASDPKTAKATIEEISAARKQYDDAITEAQTRLVAANEAEKKAEAAAAKAENAADKAEKKKLELEARTIEVNDLAAAVAEDQRMFNVYKDEVAKQAADLMAERKASTAALSVTMADLAKKSAALDAKDEVLNQKIGEANALKAELEEKLAKFKALAA
jgi:chromosome segregation ATPase